MNTPTLSDIAFVEAEVLADFAQSRAKAGNALHFPAFNFNRILKWTPPQRAALEAGIQSLSDRGYCRMEGESVILTQLGVDTIFPPPGDFVERSVLQWFRNDKAKAGTVLFIPAFLSDVRAKWNPRQEADLDAGIARLTERGLVSPTSGSVALTESGFKYIYQQ